MAHLTLRFAQAARSELNDLLAYIAFDNSGAASKLAGNIEKSLDRLLEFPDSGRTIPEAPSSRARELVVPPIVRIFYRTEGDVLRVLHVMRAEQAFPPKGW
jgi:plasmid stabilization system protein ParE